MTRVAFTLTEAADQLGVNRKTLLRAAKNGELKTFRIGSVVMVSKPELERLISGVPANNMPSPQGSGGDSGGTGRPAPDPAPGPSALSHDPFTGTETR